MYPFLLSLSNFIIQLTIKGLGLTDFVSHKSNTRDLSSVSSFLRNKQMTILACKVSLSIHCHTEERKFTKPSLHACLSFNARPQMKPLLHTDDHHACDANDANNASQSGIPATGRPAQTHHRVFNVLGLEDCEEKKSSPEGRRGETKIIGRNKTI